METAGLNPLVHFVRWGSREGRNPSPRFSTSFYAQEYPDVAASGLLPLVHYVRCREPRRTIPYAFDPQRHAPATTWYDADRPHVSIIVLNWNDSGRTAACLDAIWRHTTGLRYEIILVDNGSRGSEFRAAVAEQRCLRVVRLPQNAYFGEGNNLGAEAARGAYLVFLNNDTTVTVGWLEPLLATFDRHPECGAAGCRLVYPDGRMQEAGALVRADGAVVQRGKDGDPANPAYQEECGVDYCSAAALAIKREVFETLGGFDYRWEPAYFEDCDLCLRLTLLGLQTWYCPSSVVIHYEGAAPWGGNESPRADVIKINRARFVDRWGAFLDSGRQTPPPELLLPAPQPRPAAAAARRELLLYSSYPVVPGGGERYLLTIAEAVRDQWSVTLMTPSPLSALRLRTVARDMRLKLDDLRLLPHDDLGRRARPFDAFVCMGNEILPPHPPLARRNLFLCQFPFPIGDDDFARRWPFWDGYERVIAYSAFSRSHILKQLGRLPLPPLPV